MSLLIKIKKELAEKLNKTLDQKLVEPEDLVYPPNKDMGDLSLPCFNLAKKLKYSPDQIAKDLKNKFKTKNISEIKVAGPYLNFFINQKTLADQEIKEIKKQGKIYGQNYTGEKQKIMIEYSNVNTHKEYHVGHLRNVCFGEAITRILTANGYQTIPVSYVNDFGIHVAKTLWNWEGYLNQNYPNQNIESFSDKKKGFILGKAYTDAAQKIKADDQGQVEVNNFMRKIESRKGKEYKLWQKTRKWNIQQFEKIYQELGVVFKDRFYESDYIEEGKKMVTDLLDQGILEKSQGAVIANLEKYNLGVLIFFRSDGTATYPVADLPLAKAKLDKYNLDKSIYVVDNRQTLYFKQLFKVLELVGYDQEKIHLSYEFVKLPSGMMSSRSGNVITYEELREIVLSKSIKETTEKHPDWSKEKITKTAEKIGMNAIKFELLKVNSANIITFDINKALSFDGFTSAYIQYTTARIKSVIKKSLKEKEAKSKTSSNKDKSWGESLTLEKEHELIIKIAKYPEIIFLSGKNFDPSEIAKYLFELSQIFNDYYHSVPILKSEKQIKLARLELLKAIEQTITNGLKLLNLDLITEM